ncbi:MAG: transcription antitermination factor NusB [Chloroflexi bacterium]|nr:transcription antitermination factor NusB [Chloroflexota bacterium]
MKGRRKARALALQVLYEVDSSNHPPGTVLEQRLEDSPLTEDLGGFAQRLIFGVLQHRADLDRMIARFAPEWPVEQMAPVDRNVLRLALWEFAIGRETPVRVAINEAVEVAKVFGSESSPRFVNGVLGSLADHVDEAARAGRGGA